MDNEPGMIEASNRGARPFGVGFCCGRIVGLPDAVKLSCVGSGCFIQEGCTIPCVVANSGGGLV